MSGTEPTIVAGRSCANCTMCCKIMAIKELAKPRNQWCAHCDIGKGCKIYAQRPPSCSDFFCTYLTNETLGEHWKPTRSRMVLRTVNDRLFILVDTDRPDAWRKEPYYSDLKNWAAKLARQNLEVAVVVGESLLFIRPDRDTGPRMPDKWLKMVTRDGQGIGGDVDLIDPEA